MAHYKFVNVSWKIRKTAVASFFSTTEFLEVEPGVVLDIRPVHEVPCLPFHGRDETKVIEQYRPQSVDIL